MGEASSEVVSEAERRDPVAGRLDEPLEKMPSGRAFTQYTNQPE
jgi:hypothetical protein